MAARGDSFLPRQPGSERRPTDAQRDTERERKRTRNRSGGGTTSGPLPLSLPPSLAFLALAHALTHTLTHSITHFPGQAGRNSEGKHASTERQNNKGPGWEDKRTEGEENKACDPLSVVCA